MQTTINKQVINEKKIKLKAINKKVISSQIINKKAIAASFSKAAISYDQFADLQREIGQHLISLMPASVKQINSILDLGCGTGYFSGLLSKLASPTNLTCFDLSPEMLKQAAQKKLTHCNYVEGDIDHLPFTTHQFDLIFSNLVVQWSEQLTLCLAQTKQALHTNGVLCFSTLLNGSLIELQQAWQQVDNRNHVNDFLSEKQVKTALQQAGFKHISLTTETRVKKYPDVISVMKALKGIGANHVHNGNHNRTSGRQLLKQLEEGYQPFIDQDGLYNLSYQVCYVIAYANSSPLNITQ